MIIDTLDNLSKYSLLYNAVNQLIVVISNKSLHEISEKVYCEDITLIPLCSEEV